MDIHLNLTGTLSSVIDYDNGGGLKTYIDIGLTEGLCSNFEFQLENFVLNLDEALIEEITSQDDTLGEQVNEEGFLIVKKATVKIAEVKGCDAQLTFRNERGEKVIVNNTWDYSLTEDDSIYDMGGRLISFPQLTLNLEIVSNGAVIISLNSVDCAFMSNYQDLLKISELLNKDRKTEARPLGKLFDPVFRSEYLNTDYNGRVSIKK
ncbi:hypothetical protein [Pseudomonas sp.]|uniref:hypothetical protein n=1 Tax=Pseudomonas sp. TaxID=306 RepID=UPI002BC2B9D6|nr:hypothetical protein [Pseudomonas sp.]HUE93018.1 hypothetical protein [Pseudomonas sp.]